MAEHSTLPESTRSVSADYRRRAGTHYFSTVDGVPVAAISAPNWEDFTGELEALPEASGYVLTPELMTATGNLADIPQKFPEIDARVAAVRSISHRHPDATVLLGTPTLDSNGRIRNSLAVIQDGKVGGYIDKRGLMWPEEERLFSAPHRQQARLRSLGHSALICSDMINASVVAPPSRNALLTSDTKTLLVGSNWAIPRSEDFCTPDSYEERFGGALTTTVDRLFLGHPNLEEVIMADRAVEGSGKAPFTAHFRRTIH